MKKCKVLLLVLCIAMMSTGLSGCGLLLRAAMKAAEEEKEQSIAAEAEDYDYDYDYDYDFGDDYEDPYSIDDMEVTDFDDVFNDDADPFGDGGDAVDDGMMTVGSDLVGYIDLPDNYYPWTEAGGMPNGSVQYCDGTPYNLVSMVYYDMPGVTAYDLASSMMDQFKTDTAISQDSLTGATVQLGGVDAYQIYAYYPNDDQWLVIWMFESPYDSYIHYVSAEFLSDNFDFFEQVENSYRFRK